MGKQLIILLTLIVGGSPNKTDGNQVFNAQASEELTIAGLDCLHAIFGVLEGPVAERTIFHEIGTATVVDQTVYILLDGLVDERSDDVCLSAANALQALFARITDRVVLASIMPRTVSALAKVLKPTTQARRSYRLLQTCLQVLSQLLRNVLNDRVATATEQVIQGQPGGDKLVLDDSWLKATSTQIKLALANVIQVRRHQRSEVQSAVLELCLIVIEECQTTLKDSLPLMVETVVVLADMEDEVPNKAFRTLAHLATTYPAVLESLKESLHTWLTSFPRTMQNNDETAKQWGIRQISTVFQILSQVQSGSDLLTSNLASGLCDSVGAVVKHNSNGLQPLTTGDIGNLSLEVLDLGSGETTFPPVLLEHRSQEQTLKDLRSMVRRLNLFESGDEITRFIVSRIHTTSNEAVIAPFWLALASLQENLQVAGTLDDFVSLDHPEQSVATSARAAIIEELYYISLKLLNEQSAHDSHDWRTSALALEAVAFQAQQLGEAFRPELMDALYPTLQLLASKNANLQRHAMTCLNILTSACNYQDTSSMIIENVDYLVNSVALKLNTFDVSPYPPQVLFMMVKLCGARLVPYLDDLVDSMFSILDLYHGYPKLVEMMFKTLASIVEEGAKKPSMLTIDTGMETDLYDHRKAPYQPLSIEAVAEDIAGRRAKRAKRTEEEDEIDGSIPHPKRPWAETYEKPQTESESVSELLEKAESDEPLPPPKEPEDTEKPLSKTHSLLLHIVKSIPSHLSSPSPFLRRSLLSILIDVLPVLAQNENSFLPLINDLWPSVVSRIIFPSSLGNESPSTTLMTRSSTDDPTSQYQSNPYDFQEETFVLTTACQAVETMCKGAGDFMATRIETEFPRWERLYGRVWEKVRQNAQAANERRSRQQQQEQRRNHPSTTASTHPDNINPSLDIVISSSLTLTPTTSTRGSRPFTPHHAIWRALLSLFITILTHVRLPLAAGDQICEILVEWIARFVEPEYYFYSSRHSDKESESADVVVRSVEEAIRAMEMWNADLTWFLFMQHRCHDSDRVAGGSMRVAMAANGGVRSAPSLEVFGGKLRFAEVVF